ncbi:DUF2637 domain-containing protein [Arthrobacter sp. ISL-48]|uniref:DUF2637 domain-containing protein n=1 Tax=Arthrobacter sp. ISL-48 TaxID=2819110 RepID=UPI0020354223|nr:DUF2637 domain-containing protein [Arthrobacter sp. ISL-48]
MSPRIPNQPHKAVLGTAVGTTVLIAMGAFILSFAALTDLAGRSGIEAHLAWIWPIIVDGMIVAATVAIVALNGHSRRAMIYPWTLLFFGAIVSTAANSVHAILTVDDLRSGIPPVVSALVAAMPPVVLLAITHLTVHMYQKRAEVAQLHEDLAALEEAYHAPEPGENPPRHSPHIATPAAPEIVSPPVSPTAATAAPMKTAPTTAEGKTQASTKTPDDGPAPLYEETVQALTPGPATDGDTRVREPANA